MEIINFVQDKEIKVILVGQIPTYPSSSYINCTKTWYRPDFAISKTVLMV